MTIAVAVLIINVLQNNNSEKRHLIYWSIFCMKQDEFPDFKVLNNSNIEKVRTKFLLNLLESIMVYKDIKNEK